MMTRKKNNMQRVAAFAAGLLLAAGAARADNVKIENVKVAPRDAKTATVTFDISWEKSWRHGGFHDAAWVFFKVRADAKTPWQPVRLAADEVVNPAGYGQKNGTPLEFVVPGGDDGFVGMFVRKATDGADNVVAARGVTAVWDFAANQGIKKDVKVRMQAFGIEMVYVGEGPFYLGTGGTEWNRFYTWTEGSRDIEPRHMGITGWNRQGDGQETPPYRVTGPGAIPTGRQKGKLWAAGLRPEDGGEIPAAFPNGYSAFYCMKCLYISRDLYAGFLNTLSPAQVRERFHIEGQGRWVTRSGTSPDYAYSAEKPGAPCPWLSWADCAAWTAWAALRPMTELEYEKAVRGPQDPYPNDIGLSYWGLAQLSTHRFYERPVSVGSALGRKFAGTHGRGIPELPRDWPADVRGAVFRGDPLYSAGYLCTSGRCDVRTAHADRHPQETCWRAARTAPAGDTIAGRAPVRFDRSIRRAVARLGRPVRCDGALDEWGQPLATIKGAEDVYPLQNRVFVLYHCKDPWRGPDDISAKVYLGSDGKALYVAAAVTDDRHANMNTGDGIAKGDSLQMGLVTSKGVHWNLALALSANGVALHQFEGDGEAVVRAADCAVVRDDKASITRYELRLPLAAIGLNDGEEFGLNAVFFDDDDGDGHRYWIQLAPGLTQPVNTALYPRFVLAK